MKTFHVVPHVGVEPVRLGMTRDESRAAMGAQSLPSALRSEKDLYYDNAFQVFFDSEDRVEYIELSKNSIFTAFYKGINVHETEGDALVDIVEKDADFDENNPELGYSFIFPTLELSVWRPTVPEDENDEEGRFFSTIGIGTKGYYSSRIR